MAQRSSTEATLAWLERDWKAAEIKEREATDDVNTTLNSVERYRREIASQEELASTLQVDFNGALVSRASERRIALLGGMVREVKAELEKLKSGLAYAEGALLRNLDRQENANRQKAETERVHMAALATVYG